MSDINKILEAIKLYRRDEWIKSSRMVSKAQLKFGRDLIVQEIAEEVRGILETIKEAGMRVLEMRVSKNMVDLFEVKEPESFIGVPLKVLPTERNEQEFDQDKYVYQLKVRPF